MYYEQIAGINQDIERTGRAIVTLGCSFTQGQGAVDDELYQKYDWHYEKLGVPLKIRLKPNQINDFLKQYPDVSRTPDGNINFVFMEYRNAFCNVLAKKYFEGSYASINLGLRGCGNRATIKELHFHPEIDWHKLKQIIVIYCPSGLERFDFVNDNWRSHHHWVSMWPHYKNVDPPKRSLWEGYNNVLWSERFEVIEQLGHVQELLQWCNNHGAQLIITPGFDRRYNREHFTKNIFTEIDRNSRGEIVKTNSFELAQRWLNDTDKKHNDVYFHEECSRLIELWPWQNMYKPDGIYHTFVDLCMAQEFPQDWETNHFFEYNGKGSPQGWITSCAHPSARGHDLFAQKLHQHILAQGW